MAEYISFDNLIRVFIEFEVELPARKRAMLVEMGRRGVRYAREALGTYQPAKGPYQAWPDLSTDTIRQRVAKGFTPNNPLLAGGQLYESIGYRLEGLDKVYIGSNDPVALWAELGTVKEPARPFMGPAMWRVAQESGDIALATVFHELVDSRMKYLRRVIPE